MFFRDDTFTNNISVTPLNNKDRFKVFTLNFLETDEEALTIYKKLTCIYLRWYLFYSLPQLKKGVAIVSQVLSKWSEGTRELEDNDLFLSKLFCASLLRNTSCRSSSNTAHLLGAVGKLGGCGR